MELEIEMKKRFIILLLSIILCNTLYGNDEKTKEIINETTERINRNPENLMSYYYRGSKFLKIKNYEKAEQDFDFAIELDKKKTGVSPRYLKAKIMLLTKREQESIEFMTEAIKQKQALCFYYQRALGYDYIEKYSEALKDYSLYLKQVKPKNFPIEYRFGFIRYVTLLLHDNKNSDAIIILILTSWMKKTIMSYCI